MLFPDIKLFEKTKRGLELVYLPHFLHGFWIKIFHLLYSINWPNFIVGLFLFREILGNVYIIIVSQPTFQRWIDFISMYWINVEITLIRRWKWNKIRRQSFNLAQRWCNFSARRWNNVETTLSNDDANLHQRCFSVVSTLVKTVRIISNPIRLLMIIDL